MISAEEKYVFFLITTYFLAVLCTDYFHSEKKKQPSRSAFISPGAIKMSSSIIKTSAFSPTDKLRNGMDSGADRVSGLMTSGTRQLPP